jgi:DNA-directed RNA polymerase beta' subunit
VKKPETIDYRTGRPEPHGLFSEEIFGVGSLEEPLLAPEDLVTATRASTFGRIVLPVPLVHPLAIAHAPDDVAERARISRAELAALAAYTEPERTQLVELLERTDQGRAIVIRELPVLPPSLRPMVKLDGGRWAISDLNDLYRRVINRANRLRRLLELSAPEVILSNEQRVLSSALRCLFENEDCPDPITDPNGRELRSLRGLAGGEHLFDGLAELDRSYALGVPPTGPMTRKRFQPIAAIFAMGLELEHSLVIGFGLGSLT